MTQESVLEVEDEFHRTEEFRQERTEEFRQERTVEYRQEGTVEYRQGKTEEYRQASLDEPQDYRMEHAQEEPMALTLTKAVDQEDTRRQNGELRQPAGENGHSAYDASSYIANQRENGHLHHEELKQEAKEESLIEVPAVVKVESGEEQQILEQVQGEALGEHVIEVRSAEEFCDEGGGAGDDGGP